MSRRDAARRQYRRALVPGLVLSAVAHALVLGLLALDVPLREDPRDRAVKPADRAQETGLEVVALRQRDARRPASTPGDGAAPPAETGERASEAAVRAPAVRTPPSREMVTERVEAPAGAVPVPMDERREERLGAAELAALFPGSDEVPRPTSRAAREASGEPRDVGDRFQAVGGTQRAGTRGGGCTVTPGTAINRRFPQDLEFGGG